MFVRLRNPCNSNCPNTVGNFTVSIEAAKGVTAGILLLNRAHTILTAIDEKATAQSVKVPGHIFPILSKEGGVLRRAGQTEGSVDISV